MNEQDLFDLVSTKIDTKIFKIIGSSADYMLILEHDNQIYNLGFNFLNIYGKLMKDFGFEIETDYSKMIVTFKKQIK